MAQNPIENMSCAFGAGSERSVEVYAYDANGDTETPTSVTWSLFDTDGNVINARDGVSETPDDPTVITLEDDDLQIEDPATTDFELRVLDVVVESSTGTFRIQRRFRVQKFTEKAV